MTCFFHPQERGTLLVPSGNAVLAALLLVLPFAPAAHGQITESECTGRTIGGSSVAWDADKCVVLDRLLIMVAAGTSLDDAETELEKRQGWTADRKMELVRIISAKYSGNQTLDLAGLKAEMTYFSGLDWTAIVELDALVSAAQLDPVDGPVGTSPVPAAHTLSKVGGDEQQGPGGLPLDERLVVSVLGQSGNPFPGAVVTFAVTAGQGSLSVTRDTTDAEGLAAAVLTLGREPGTCSVEVTAAGLDPVTFTATAKATSDFNGDGATNFVDFFLFADAFGGSDPRFDLNGNGSVGIEDFFLFVDQFGEPARAKLVTAETVQTRKPTLLR